MSISNKLIYLGETKELIQEKINDIGGELTDKNSFREYAEELDNLYNNMPKVLGEGSEITLNNTRKGKTIITPKGNLNQKKFEGYNLLKYPYIEATKTVSGITFTDNRDGTVTISGTATENVKITLDYFNFVEGETYTIVDGLNNNRYRRVYYVSCVI